MISEDGMKLVEFVNNSFSTSIKSALEKQSKEKRRINSRKYIEKNRQKTARKSVKAVNSKPKVTGNKSQSQRLQQNRFYNHMTTSVDESQCLPPWPAFDNGYTILPGCTVPETSLVFPPAFTPQQGGYQSRLPVAMTQSTLDLEQMLQTLIDPQIPVSLPTQFTAPFETTVDYPIDRIDSFSESRPLSPYNNSNLSPYNNSNVSDKEYLEDLMIDQLESSPASAYESSPIGSCVPSPANRVCDSQMSYAMYEHLPYH